MVGDISAIRVSGVAAVSACWTSTNACATNTVASTSECRAWTRMARRPHFGSPRWNTNRFVLTFMNEYLSHLFTSNVTFYLLVRFSNNDDIYLQECPFTIYMDLESVLLPIYGPHPNPVKSSTTSTEKHVVCGASYTIVSRDPRFYNHPVVMRGEDIMPDFLTSMKNDVARLKESLSNITPMEKLSPEQIAQVASPNAICHICKRGFTEENRRVRDHDHLNSKFR